MRSLLSCFFRLIFSALSSFPPGQPSGVKDLLQCGGCVTPLVSTAKRCRHHTHIIKRSNWDTSVFELPFRPYIMSPPQSTCAKCGVSPLVSPCSPCRCCVYMWAWQCAANCVEVAYMCTLPSLEVGPHPTPSALIQTECPARHLPPLSPPVLCRPAAASFCR